MFKKILSYAIGIIIPVAVGGLAALLTRNNMNIYQDIVTPAFTPPAILFPIVWSILYVLMGIGSILVYHSDAEKKDKIQALILYGAQLIVNFFWSIFFFNERLFLFAFVWLILLWILIVAMIVKFAKINKASAWLQLPYLLWVTFAGYLNLAIYLLN